jgi:putative methionine-R-sulfoxide reductase with GAF domain
MTLAARRPKPACSPIGVHGACGQCLLAGRTLVVRDVRDLGEGYIACDPRDQSELVVPCMDAQGRPWGVLDVDSHVVASFSAGDGEAACELLALAGLSHRGAAG